MQALKLRLQQLCLTQSIIQISVLFELTELSAFCLFQGIRGLYRGYTSTVLREVTHLIPSTEVQKNDVLCSAKSLRETG